MTACCVSQGHLSLITQLSTNYSLTSFTPFPCKSQGSPLKQIGPISCRTIASSRLLKAKNLTHTNKYFCFKTLSSYLAVMAMIFGCYALQKASEFSNKKACFCHQWPEFSEGIFFFFKRQTFFHISHLSFLSEAGNLVLAHIYHLSCQSSYSPAAGGCMKAWEGDKIVSVSEE